MYLDAAATTKPDTEVIKSMLPYMQTMWHNPSSLYKPAKEVKEIIEKSRKTVADFICANQNEIYFTSGGSESNCWAIQGFIQNRICKGRVPSIITTTIEHKSILSCLEGNHVDVHYVSVDKEGYVNLKNLEDVLKYVASQTDSGDDILVSVQFALILRQYRLDQMLVQHRYGIQLHTYV